LFRRLNPKRRRKKNTGLSGMKKRNLISGKFLIRNWIRKKKKVNSGVRQEFAREKESPIRQKP
jgi:hypothetical protein